MLKSRWNESIELENGRRFDYYQAENGLYHGQIVALETELQGEYIESAITAGTMNELWSWLEEHAIEA